MSQGPLPHLHIVILCEDYGAQLWPIAREDVPMCLTPAEPGSSLTLLAAAVRRGAPHTSAPLTVVTTQGMSQAITDELAGIEEAVDLGVDLLVQPLDRGSAFAISLAAARIRRSDPQAVIMTMRADQRAVEDERWAQLVYRAYQIALQDRIVILGGTQEEKCLDNTYIRKGRQYSNVTDAFEVRLFSAEQTASTARRVCSQGALWHTGIILSRAAVVMGEMARAGEMERTLESSASQRIAETANFMSALDSKAWLDDNAREVLGALPRVSLEKAMLEVSDRLVVIPTNMAFSSLRALTDLDTLADENREHNRTIDGAGLLEQCRNTTVFSRADGRKVVGVGLRDVVILELEDMTVVVDKHSLDDLDDIRKQLQ